jgi:hypothetical protein
MTDRASLHIVGYILTGVTAIVIGVGVFVVQGHMSGRYVLGESSGISASLSIPIPPETSRP